MQTMLESGAASLPMLRMQSQHKTVADSCLRPGARKSKSTMQHDELLYELRRFAMSVQKRYASMP